MQSISRETGPAAVSCAHFPGDVPAPRSSSQNLSPAGPDSRGIPAWLVCLIALVVFVAGPQRPLAADPLSVRVLSYNIHHGEGVDGKIDLERIAGVIRSVAPDLVALQEVDRNTSRSGGVDQPRVLAELTGLAAVFERNIEYQGGDYGNAVLSRFPIVRHKNHHLPSLFRGEQRGALEVEVDLGQDNRLLFLATHLDYRPDDRERMKSAAFINELVKDRSIPAILAGDLNARPDSRVLARFEELWERDAGAAELATFPVSRPVAQIDYILYRPAGRWKVLEHRVLDEAVASDHRPIFAVLQLEPAGN